MSKFFLTLVACSFAFALYGQSNSLDVLYLKNGSIIKGTITSIEQTVTKTVKTVAATTRTIKSKNGKAQSVTTPSSSVVVEQIGKIVKIKSVDGNLWVFNMDEIEKIIKEEVPVATEKVVVAPDSLTRVRLIVAKRDTVVVEKKKEEVAQKVNIVQKKPTSIPKILAERDPLLACAFSALVPGLGQIYNGELAKGVTFMATTFIPLIISAQAKETNAKLSSAFGYIALASYLCNIIEAPFRSTTLNSQRAIARRKYKRSSFIMRPNVDYLYATNGQYIPETGYAGVKITYQIGGK
ncbi:MAG: hypothetical protein H6Q17_448 [Bacteroidetes bacterium]|nr:hypothetical protein [Bacteroidota bacterium]